MDSDSPQDVYAKCLPNSRGYPLWFPEPSNRLPSSYRQDGLQIGDVGHVSRKGTFNVLFNVCYGPNHALHQRLGVSFSFHPIELNDHEVEVISNADPPGYIITSPGITQPSRTSQRDGHYEFTPSPAKGAILILPDGATSHDLPANERFRKVAMEHAFDWYEIAKEHYGESISSGSLYLITGFYKARSWSLASFHDATGTEPRNIKVIPREGEPTIARREWMCTFPVQYRDGPGPDHNGSVNQTIFISGFKIAVRDDVLGWMSQKPKVQLVPADRSRKGPCFTRCLMWLFGKKNTSKRSHRENGGADVKDVPALSQPIHPSDLINRYLLNKDPDALVAVTHDSEWITLIETGKLTPEELAQGDRLEELLSENYSLVSQSESSAVYLQGKSEDVSNSALSYSACVQHEVSSTPKEFQTTRPSADDFQVVITRIRAEDVAAGFRRMPVGFYVLIQFDATKRRTENKLVYLHDNVVEWDDRIQLPSEPSAKVKLSLCASFEFSPLLGNGETLRTVEISVGHLPDYTHVVTFPPTQGGPLSPCSSFLITMERRLSHKSGAASDHDHDLDFEDSSDLAQLTDQGHNALFRCRDDPRKENVAVAVEYFKRALSRCSNDHQCYAAALCNLARAHFIKCQIDRGSVELSTAISYYREALKLRRVGHPDRPGTLLHLAEVLLYRYGELGFQEFPGEIVELMSEVQASCSEDSHERRAADFALQTYALYQAICSCSLADIDKSISGFRQAAREIPEDYFDKVERLSRLSLALWIRYEICGDLGSLNESIAIHEEGMLSTPCDLDSPTCAQLLKKRANATLTSSSWKDALVIAASFPVPRFAICRITYQRLETIGRITDASECLHQMVKELVEEANAHDEQVQWVLRKLEGFGDTAMSDERHEDAISHYSAALSLSLAAPSGLFIKHRQAYILATKDLWEEVLNDVQKGVSCLTHSLTTLGNTDARIRFQNAVRAVIMLQRTTGKRSMPVRPVLSRRNSWWRSSIAVGPDTSSSPVLGPRIRPPTEVRVIKKTLKELELVQELLPHRALVQHIQFSPNGKYLATSSGDRTAVIFRVGEETLTHHRTLIHARDFVSQVAWSPNGRLLLTRFTRGLKLWSEDGVCKQMIDRFKTISSVVWLPNGQAILSVEGNEVVKLDLHGKILDVYHLGHVRLINVAVTSDCLRLIAIGPSVPPANGPQPTRQTIVEKRIIVYSMHTKRKLSQTLLFHDVLDLVISKRMSIVLVSFERAPPQLWKLKILRDKARTNGDSSLTARLNLQHSFALDVPTSIASSCYFGGKDEQFVVCVGKAGSVHIWDRETAALLHHFRPMNVSEPRDMTCIGWNNGVDEPMIFATGSHDGTVCVWSTVTVHRAEEEARQAILTSRGSTRVARTFPEGSANVSIRNPYTQMESSDSLKRKQTILSLIDMLSEQGDNSAFEATGSPTLLEEDLPISHDEKLSNVGAELFFKFEKQVANLDKELHSFTDALAQLGGSVEVLVAMFKLRERLTKILFLFRENAANLYPLKIARNAREDFPDLDLMHQHQQTHLHGHAPVVKPVLEDNLEPDSLPAQLESFAKDLVTFLDCFNEFLEFTDEAINQSMRSFEADLKYWASCLAQYKNQFHSPAVLRYVLDLTMEIGNHIVNITGMLCM
ncbi:hypothetical protein OG21DRAFT_1515937 [Imleria badia]|nr:hypothetical protein OG21DRAFT_1515937 [Imleria badia]